MQLQRALELWSCQRNRSITGQSGNFPDRQSFRSGVAHIRRQFGRGVDERIRALYLVELNDRHSLKEQFTTLLHELAHLLLGHVGRHPAHVKSQTRKSHVPNGPRTRLPHAVQEFEVGAGAFLVSGRLYLTAPSEQYLAGSFNEMLRNDWLSQFAFERLVLVASRLEAWALQAPKRDALQLL